MSCKSFLRPSLFICKIEIVISEPWVVMRKTEIIDANFLVFMVYNLINSSLHLGFPGSSAGKESACHAGDPSSISGSGISPGEGIGYPLQYSWASRGAQLVKNQPAMRETWDRSLGWEDLLEKGAATHSSILAWRATVHRVAKSRTRLSTAQA